MKKLIITFLAAAIFLVPIAVSAEADFVATDNFEAVATPPNTSGEYASDVFAKPDAVVDVPYGKTFDVVKTVGYNNTAGLLVTNKSIANTKAGQRRGAWIASRNLTVDADTDAVMTYKIKIENVPSDTYILIGGLSYSIDSTSIGKITKEGFETAGYNNEIVNCNYEKGKWYTVEIRIDGAKSTASEWYYYTDIAVLDEQSNVLLSANSCRVTKHNNAKTNGLKILPFRVNHYGTESSEDYNFVCDDFRLTQYKKANVPKFLGCSVDNGKKDVPRNASFVFKFDIYSDLVTDCIVTKDGIAIDKSLYNVKSCVTNKLLNFNSILDRNSNYSISMVTSEGTSVAQLYFQTENMHEMGLSILSVRDGTGTAIEKPKQGSIKLNYEINDPLRYPEASGLVMAVLYDDNEMVWMDFVTFSNEPLVNGKAELSANFELPAVESDYQLKLMLFDYENFLCPVNSGIKWN